MNNYKCFLKLKDSEKFSLVELPWSNRPIVGQTKPISASEVDQRTPMPEGRTLGAYAVPRVVIKIVTDLGEQKHLGETHPTFEYVRGSL